MNTKAIFSDRENYWRRDYDARADATEEDGVLFSIDDAPDGLTAVEVVFWVDQANAYLKAGKLKATAIKLANQAVEDADIETESLDKWDTEDD